MNRHAPAAAALSAFIAAVCVLSYLLFVTYGWASPSNLWSYVAARKFDLGAAEEALFVVVSRFLLAFGFSWAPLALLIALIRRQKRD